VDWCIDALGLAYHPDTSVADYVTDDNHRVFDDHLTKRLDYLHEEAFEAGHAERMYAHGLHRFHAAIQV